MSFVKLFRLAAIAFVVLQTSPARAEAATIIDWSKGDVQATDASCGNITFKNMADRHGYSLWVRGTTSGTCVFESKGLKFHLPSNYGATTRGTSTVYGFGRIGPDVVVTWMPGY